MRFVILLGEALRIVKALSIGLWLFGQGLSTAMLAGEVEFSFRSSFDQSTQKAVAYIPSACTNSPLLIIAHPMGGSRLTAKGLGYYAECEKRGWLLVCPDLHGHRTPGQTSLAALEAQHDIMDVIQYMKQHYLVDRSRIYLAGRSMGGMLGQIMAAKYPDQFAAVVAGQGISDLAEWIKTAPAELIKMVEEECQPFSDATRFEYERRSSINFAPNLKYVPLILWHGTNDHLVDPEQSEKLVDAIRRYNRFQPAVTWLQGAAHTPMNFPPKWICDQLEYYVNTGDGAMAEMTRFYPELSLVLDEEREIFWLLVTPAKRDRFARIEAKIQAGLLSVKVSQVSRVVVNLEKVLKDISVSKYAVSTDCPLELVIKKGGSDIFKVNCEKEATGEIHSGGNAKQRANRPVGDVSAGALLSTREACFVELCDGEVIPHFPLTTFQSAFHHHSARA